MLPAKHDLILESRGQMQIFKSHPSVFCSCPKFIMLALRVDFGYVFGRITDSVQFRA